MLVTKMKTSYYFFSPSNQRDILVLLALMLIGGMLRFYYLGASSLAGNEDYLAISVNAILETGIPLFPTDILYPRALPMSYITAAFVQLFGFSEFTLRLPSSIFSTLTIPLIYIFSRQIIGRNTGLIAAAITTVFFWEIVMAQTGRMYAMFSFTVLLTFVFLHAAEIEGKQKLRLPALIILALATSLHSISLAFIPMFIALVPYFISKGRKPGILLVYLLVLGLSFMVSNQFSKNEYQRWHNLTTQNIDQSVADTIEIKESRVAVFISKAAPLLQKNVLLTDKNKIYWVAVIAFLFTLLLAVFFIPDWRVFFSFVTLLVVALSFQQVIFAGCIWLFYLFIGNWFGIRHFKISAFVGLCILCIGAMAWVLVELLSSKFTGYNTTQAIKMLFAYPPMFLRLMAETFPWLTLIFIITSFWIAVSTSKAQQFSGPALVLFLFILPLFLMGIHPLALERLYDRYIYFLTPYFIIIIAFGIFTASHVIYKKWQNNKQIIAVFFGMAIVLLIILSGGFSLTRSLVKANTIHGINTDIYDRWTKKHYYHPDHKGPSQFVASHYRDGDIVIAMDILAHYAYFPVADYQLTISKKRDAEGWIGSTTISNAEELTSILNNAKSRRIWIVTAGLHIRDNKDKKEFVSIMNTISKLAGKALYFGEDGDSNVYCVGC
ncbi:hypothetical protein MNBD_GAMMA16-1978 [hydrothermal vent metagenome]|uniref:Glycosyltransferase RgtA/B/C/D-like domain-containing protein n=1 Tax=hydrothermal vent metagenome TaxID=652676 RepID=A0A3B0ZGZ7_9ZZZZ